MVRLHRRAKSYDGLNSLIEIWLVARLNLGTGVHRREFGPMNRPETDGDAADARKTGIEQVSEVKEVNSAVDEKEDPSPVAKTLSTGRILLILGSIWIGLFFAALGA